MRAILPHIVEQHAEEAAFLWLLREAAADAPHYDRDDLAQLEQRLEAHLDGLRVAGEAGHEIARAQLAAHEEPGELFTAAVLALESGEAGHTAALLEVGERNQEARPGLLGAVGWCRPGLLKPQVQTWLLGVTAFERFLGVCACSMHRADPGKHLRSLLQDPDPLVRARTARLAGEIGRADAAGALLVELEADPTPARAWSTWSLGLLGERSVVPAVEQLAEAGFGPALHVAVRLMSPDAARSWLRQLNGDSSQGRLVVRGLGLLGDSQAVPWLIGRMSDPTLARLAGESFSLITGVDLERDDLEGEAAADVEAGPTPDPADPDVAMDPDDDLPWPDPELIEDWWAKNRGRFTAGERYLLGRAIDADACEQAWRIGFQRQRRAAAYELALRRPEAPLRNWRARQ